MIRHTLVLLALVTPTPVKRWLYRHPRLLGPLARLLKSVAPPVGSEPMVVTLKDGPIAGMKLAVDQSTPNFYWLTGGYEAHLLPFLRERVRRGMVAADVGAHIGYDTLMLARLVGAEGAVLAFEPDPLNRAQLERNIAINELANVRVFGCAVSDRLGAASFDAQATTTSRLSSAGRSQVELFTLDALVYDRHEPAPAFIKIDVEGHEAAVLIGARRLLEERRPALLVEVHSVATLGDCVRQLRSVGYTLEAPGNDGQARAVAAVLRGEQVADDAIERGYLAAV